MKEKNTTPDVINIDVEGAEMDVFRGGKKILQKSKYVFEGAAQRVS